MFFLFAACALAALPGSSAAPSKRVARADAVPSLPVAARIAMPPGKAGSGTHGLVSSLPLAPALFFQAAPIATYATDCTTPKTSFSLGETVCAKVSGAPVGTTPLRRIVLGNTVGFYTDRLDVTASSQTFTFTLPSAATAGGVDNRGNWTVGLIDTDDATLRTAVIITVHDPDQAVADLTISKLGLDDGGAVAGSNVTYQIYIWNRGPDAATNARFSDNTLPNTTFVSLTQDSGPAFTCSSPTAGTAGTSTCTRGTSTAPLTFNKGDSAVFTAVYHVNGTVSNGTELNDTATVASDTFDSGPGSDNYDVTTTAQNNNPPPCTISCPSNVTQDSDPGQAGAIVSYSAPTTSGTCQPVSTDHPSGSFFPIGTTVVNANAGTGVDCAFTVTVIDKRSVAVTLNGASDITVECRNGFTDPGATATDGTNSLTVTATVTVPDPSGATDSNGDALQVPAPGNVVDPNTPNEYTITYTASDANGHTGKAVRVVHVVDTAPPVITLSGVSGFTPQTETVTVTNDDGTTSTVTETILVGTVECHDGFAPPSATAFDGCDNHSVPVTTVGSVDTGTPGNYEIIFRASDASGNDAEQRVRVTVVDTTGPVISLNGASPMTVECHTSFTDPGASASDACEGPVSVSASGSVNPNVVGTYTITYTASDSGGRTTTATRTVNVVDTTPPVVTLNGASSVTVECHTSYTDAGASATDSCSPTTSLSSTSDVNVNAPGTYHVVWSATDPSGNTGTATRTVVVVDTIPPVISCPANITVYLPLHTTDTSMAVSYPAATASDSCDGTPTVTYSKASGSVFNVGTTPVTATATDDSGNAASCTFTVTVLYDFTGFFAPVSNPPTLNVVNAGRAIPVKFSLSGNKGLGIFPANSPQSGVIPCDASAPAVDLTDTVTAGGSSLSYDSGSDQYVYTWKTESSWAGTCRQLQVTLNDGTVHTAIFKFK